MKVLALSIGAAAFLLSASIAGAQQADYSGTWVLDPTRSDSAAQADSAEPITITRVITMGPSEVTIERREAGYDRTFLYRTDGFPTITTVGPERTVTTLRWDGPNLVTDTVSLGANPIAETEVHKLNDDGSEMVIETTLRLVERFGDEGLEEPTGTPAESGKDTYIRR